MSSKTFKLFPGDAYVCSDDIEEDKIMTRLVVSVSEIPTYTRYSVRRVTIRWLEVDDLGNASMFTDSNGVPHSFESLDPNDWDWIQISGKPR